MVCGEKNYTCYGLLTNLYLGGGTTMHGVWKGNLMVPDSIWWYLELYVSNYVTQLSNVGGAGPMHAKWVVPQSRFMETPHWIVWDRGYIWIINNLQAGMKIAR